MRFLHISLLLVITLMTTKSVYADNLTPDSIMTTIESMLKKGKIPYLLYTITSIHKPKILIITFQFFK